MLETIIKDTQNQPEIAVIWLHGLGADGNDFVPLLPQLPLGDLGSFSLRITSDGAVDADSFNSSMIIKRRMVFRPGREVKNVLNTIKFEKVS